MYIHRCFRHKLLYFSFCILPFILLSIALPRRSYQRHACLYAYVEATNLSLHAPQLFFVMCTTSLMSAAKTGGIPSSNETVYMNPLSDSVVTSVRGQGAGRYHVQRVGESKDEVHVAISVSVCVTELMYMYIACCGTASDSVHLSACARASPRSGWLLAWLVGWWVGWCTGA